MKTRLFKYATPLLALAAVLGFGAYGINRANAQPPPKMAKVTVKNFGFEPKEVTIAAGGEVEWTDEGGRHTVNSDDGSFKSDTLVAGGKFTHKFDKAGRYMYYCNFHGAMGGKDMAGVVVVK
jgi:plastocyanin